VISEIYHQLDEKDYGLQSIEARVKPINPKPGVKTKAGKILSNFSRFIT